jgi:hypothetical protein
MASHTANAITSFDHLLMRPPAMSAHPACILTKRLGLAAWPLAILLTTAPTHAARLALVIGNDHYQSVAPLRNAGADADTMAAAFRRAGYAVTLKHDLDFKAFKDELRGFRRRVHGGDEVVVYFSGHGVQLSSDNYLLPVDVRAESEDQVRDDAVPLSQVLNDLHTAQAAFTLAIIDACRDNPFPRTGRAIGGRGLARAESATGQMVLYAAGVGQQALDRLSPNDPVRNGVFTRVFVDEMARPGVPVDQVLKNVRIKVNELALSVKHEQVPALYDQVLGTFYFYPPGSPATRPPDRQVASVDPVSVPAPLAPRPSQAVLDVDKMQAAINSRFIAWSASWGWDRYVPDSARVSDKACSEGGCKVDGNFVFARFGAPHTITFSAAVTQQGDEVAVQRLCYDDNTSGMRDCVNGPR